MNKQKESFPFDVSLELNEKRMMGVTSSEVYNTVYSIIPINNKLETPLTKQQLKELGIDTELVPIVAILNENSDDKFLGKKTKKFMRNSYYTNSKPTRKDFNDSNELIEVFICPDQQIKIPYFEIELDYIRMELPPGAYELVEINAFIK